MTCRVSRLIVLTGCSITLRTSKDAYNSMLPSCLSFPDIFNYCLDILTFWKNQVRDTCYQKDVIEQRHREVVLVRHAYVTWLMKWKQLKKCEEFHRKTTCRR